MKKNLEIIGNSPLFAVIALEDIEAVLKCLQAQIKEYEKNELLLQSGSQMKRFGMILHGSVLIQKMMITAGYRDEQGFHEKDLKSLEGNPYILTVSGTHKIHFE